MSNIKRTIYRDFVNGETAEQQVIAEFTSSINGGPYIAGNANKQGLLFTVQNDQSDDRGNQVGSITFTPNIDDDGYVKDSSVSINLKPTGSGVSSTLTEAFTVSGEGGFTGKSIVINRPDTEGDVSLILKQDNTTKFTVGIDDTDDNKFKINPGEGGLADTSAFEMDSSGNVTINGSLTTIASTNTIITDNLIELNNGVVNNANDSGIVIERGAAGDNAFMGWDESEDAFILGTTTATGASTGNLTITAGDLTVADLTTADITANNLKVAEKADAPDHIATYGQIWVKTAEPNELYFTNDDGNDIQITSGSSLVNPLTLNNNADNRIITGSDTADTLNGEANLTFDGSLLTVTGNLTATGDTTLANLTATGDTTLANLTLNNTINTTASSGTNTKGIDLSISAGKGTGTGEGGSLVFRVAENNNSSATTANNLFTALTIKDDRKATFSKDVDIGGSLMMGNTQTISQTLLTKQLGGTLNGEANGDNFGVSCDMNYDGSIVAIGANQNDGGGSSAGHVRVYQYNSGTESWDQLGSDIDGDAASDRLGNSVSLSKDGLILAVGASSASYARVLKYNSGSNSWTQLGSDITGTGDNTGSGVSLNDDGTIIAVGASYNDDAGANAGQMRVFQYNSGTDSWSQLGSDIDGDGAGDNFGTHVSINGDGTIVAASGPNYDFGTINNGHVRVYKYSNNTWSLMGSEILGQETNDLMRVCSLNGDGNIIAVSSPFNDGPGFPGDYGQIRIFEYRGTSWVQLGSDIVGEAHTDYFGYGLALSYDGYRVIAGAYENDNGGSGSGNMRVFEYSRSSNSWTQIASSISGSENFQRLGLSVSISGDGTRIVGTSTSDNLARVYKFYPEISFNVNDAARMYIDKDGNVGIGTTSPSSKLDVVGDTATFTSANSTDPLVEIKNTTNDANGARLRLTKDKGDSGAANDVNGLIEFYGDNSAEEQVKFSEIKSQVKVATDGEEGGKFTISVAEHNGTSTAGLVIEDGDADGELDVTIAAGASSLTTISGDMSVIGNITLDDGGSLTASGTNALTFNAGGNITKIGQDTPSDGEFLKWDHSNGYVVWDSSAAGTTINNNADNRIITGSGTADTLNGEADLTFDGSTFNIQSSSSGAPTLVIKNTTNDANSGGMIFTKDKGAAGADGDDLGFILFKGDDSGENQTDFAKIIGEVSEATDTEEAGKLSLQVAASDGTTTALVTGLLLEGEHDTGGEVDVSIGAGASSLTTVAGNLTVNGNTTTFTADTTSVNPNVIIKNKNTGSNGGRIQFLKDREVEFGFEDIPADNDHIGEILFTADNSAYSNVNFAKILGQVSEVTSTDEAGKLSLQVAASDGTTTALVTGLLLEGEHATGGEVDVTIAAGASSLTTVAGDLTVNGTVNGNITVGAGKTLNVSAGTLTLADNQISGDNVEGGTIGSITISQLGGAMDCNSQAMTNVNIDSGTIDGATIATSQLGGAMDCNSQAMTNVNIDSGNIDNTTIGGTTPAAGTFSNLTANGTTTFTNSGAHNIPSLTKGAGIQYESITYNDTATAASGTAASFALVNIDRPTLSASSNGVITTEASTVKIAGEPIAGANQTITGSTSLLVDQGTTKLKGQLILGNSSSTSGQLKFSHSGNTNFTTIKPTDSGDNVTYTLPGGLPIANGYNLTSDTSGTLSWSIGTPANINSLSDANADETNLSNSLILGTDISGNGGLSNANNNVGVGIGILGSLTEGDNNTVIGYGAGGSLTTGNNNIIIGYNAQASANNATNEITLGNSSIQTLRCGATTIAAISDRRDKTDITDSRFGLDFLNKIRPVEFTWQRRELEPSDKNHINNGKRRVGFIAQEFLEAMPNGENELLDLVHESNPERIEAKYGNLIPVLVKSIQDLQKKVEELETKINAQ